MVIFTHGKLYHGKDALKIMAEHGEVKGFFMLASKDLFWSETLSQLMYPWMRGALN